MSKYGIKFSADIALELRLCYSVLQKLSELHSEVQLSFNQSSACSLTNRLSGDSGQLIKWVQSGVQLLGWNRNLPAHGVDSGPICLCQYVQSMARL